MVSTTRLQWSKIRIVVAIILLFLILVGLAAFGQKRTHPEEVHYHAGFRIYKNNQLVDFSQAVYMHFKPCGQEDKHDENDPRERAHLHDLIGDVVHVHRVDATWGDLLENLRFKLESPAKYYLNGVEVEDLRGRVIAPYDRMLILIGSNDNVTDKLNSVPNRDKVQEVEKKSEGC